MPLIPEESRNKSSLDHEQMYRNLKRKLKLLIYENECYQEELKKCQRQLLNVNRDKCFLLERLLKYEDINTSSSDSDATDTSDSEVDVKPPREPPPSTNRRRRRDSNSESTTGPGSQTATSKRKRINSTSGSSPQTNVTTGFHQQQHNRGKGSTNLNKGGKGVSSSSPSSFTCSPLSQVIVKSEFPVGQINSEPSSILSIGRVNGGQLTPEEIERHFDSRPVQPSLLLPEKTPLTVPVELFSNESSHDSPDIDIKTHLSDG